MKRESTTASSFPKSLIHALSCIGLAGLLAVQSVWAPISFALADEVEAQSTESSESAATPDDIEVADGTDESSEDEQIIDIADAAVREEGASEGAATQDPVEQIEALGIPTDPSEVEGYDPAADQAPEEDPYAPTGYDENATAPDDGIALLSDDGASAQSDSSSVRVGDWSYATWYDEDKEPYYVVDGYYGNGTSITLPSTLDGKQITCVSFDNHKLPDTVTSVTIPASITRISGFAFAYSRIEKVSFEANSKLTEIANYAFYNTPITEFTLPESVKEVGNLAFGNTLLSKLTLNANLESMENTVKVLSDSNYDTPTSYGTLTTHFNPCAGNTDVEFVVPANSKNYRVENGALLSKDGTILYAQPSNLNGGVYTVPSSVKILGAYAMHLNDTFSGIVLPQGLTTMEQNCLSYTAITALDMPDSVAHVQGKICEECTSLQSVRISNNLDELGEKAGWECFYGCTSLTELTLGSKLRVIGNACFAESKLTSVVLPDSLEQINYGAFGDIKTLKSVTGGSNLRYIYNLAFRYAGITSFPFGKNLRYVSNTAFKGCNFTPSYPSYLEEQQDGYYAYDGTLAVRGNQYYSLAWQVLDLVNQERAEQGLAALAMDKDLLSAAMQRAAETSICFDHTRPTGRNCFSISSKMTRENIASGSTTAERVVNNWMSSSGHRANILSTDTKSIGIGCVKVSGTYYWVQCFGTSATTTVSKPTDTTNTLLKINFMNDALSSFGSRFEIYSVSSDGKSFVNADGSLQKGTSQRYALVTFPWGSNFARTIIDDSCITWSLAGTCASLNESTVQCTNNGEFTLSAAVGNSAIKKSITRTIVHEITNATVEVTAQTYTGKALTPTPKVTLNGVTLKQGNDYSVTYQNNTNAGKATITITGNGEYSGTATTTFNIKQADASKATVTTAGQTYTGAELTPSPIVTFNGKTLKQGTDYDSWYWNNTNIGTGHVTVAFKGNYTGYAEGTFKISAKAAAGIVYQAHVQNIGWQSAVSDGAIAGTSGKSLRVEALRVSLKNADYAGGVQIRAHVQDIGWQGWSTTGGTSGQSKRVEAMQIRLTCEMAKRYDVYYRVHAQNIGWMGWAKNGASAGTEGYSYRLEAIQVKLVPKGSAAPGSTANCFRKAPATVQYQAHVQNIGWQAAVSGGATAGTSGQSLRVEALKVSLKNADYAGSVQIRAHVQDIGWQGWSTTGGTTGQSKRVEAMQIRLTGEMANHYDVYYRVHAQNIGWMGWAKNGEQAGTAGYSYRLEAVQVKLVPKGSAAPGSTANRFRSK